ncbi:MAG: transposase [Gammaproteobacteria bacterium]|nr:transposase [Gammaproteobacteria bacterium]
MARLPRIVVAGQPLHIIQRGNNRHVIFFADDDYHRYLGDLRLAARRCACAVHAYVLMTNHVHLLVTPEDTEGPSRMMQAIGRRYVRYVNQRYRRTGTLWEGRFKSALIDSDAYLLACSRYIELNPLRARMVRYPREYRWSSYPHNAYGATDAALSEHPLYRSLAASPEGRQAAYRALFEHDLDNAILNTIRSGTEKGDVIGNDQFRARIQQALQRQVVHLRHGGDRKSQAFRQQQG